MSPIEAWNRSVYYLARLASARNVTFSMSAFTARFVVVFPQIIFKHKVTCNITSDLVLTSDLITCVSR